MKQSIPPAQQSDNTNSLQQTYKPISMVQKLSPWLALALAAVGMFFTFGTAWFWVIGSVAAVSTIVASLAPKVILLSQKNDIPGVKIPEKAIEEKTKKHTTGILKLRLLMVLN
jgi:hypothetical protein